MAENERKSKVILGVETTGTEKAKKELQGIGKTADILGKELASIGRDRAVDALVKDFRAVSAEGKDAEDAVSRLNRELTKLGATETEIRSVARAISTVEPKPGSGGGAGAPAAAKFRGAASLIGGGEIIGLLDDFQDLGEGLGQLKGSLKDIPGGVKGAVSALGTAGLVGAIALAGAAIGAIQQRIADDAKKAAGIIDQYADAASFAATHTSEEIKAEIAAEEQRVKGLEAAKKATEDVLRPLEQHVAAMPPLQQAHLEFNTAIGTGGAELKSARDAADAASTAYGEGTKRLDFLTASLDDVSVAANDAAAAEKKLAQERTQSILDTADAAGRETAAIRQADDASYESNLARVGAIDDETAAINAQLDVLKSSGDTSEAVTGKIESLTAQLGALGGEADYINSTALAASKLRDEAKKAAKDAEDAEKKAIADHERNVEQAAAAQEKYSDSIKNATTNFKNAVEDIGTKRRTGAEDIGTSERRDLFDIELKNNRDLTKLISEDWRSARDDAIKNAHEIEDIRDEGLKASREALQDGNFKEAFLAKRDAAERIALEAKTDDREEQMRKLHLQDAKDDLKTALRDESSLRRTASQRAFDDLRLSSQRELETAATARQRAVSLGIEARNSEFAQLQGHYQRLTKLQQNYFAGVEQMASGLRRAGNTQSAHGISGTGSFNASQTIPMTYLGQVIRR